MKAIKVIILILALLGILLILKVSKRDDARLMDVVEVKQETEPSITEGRYCFSRVVEATKLEPYSSSENMILDIKGDGVIGRKAGTQSGPDMTNGYQGELSGVRKDDTLELLFSYTIEGSDQQELEIYQINSANISKFRYSLLEEDGVLVPDRTGEPKIQTYKQENCENFSLISNE